MMALSHSETWVLAPQKKKTKEVFTQAALRITIETNQKVVNYLDITFNLLTEKCYLIENPGTPFCTQTQNQITPPPSPSILRQLPKAVSQRVSDQSCNKKEFYRPTHAYNDALKFSNFL